MHFSNSSQKWTTFVFWPKNFEAKLNLVSFVFLGKLGFWTSAGRSWTAKGLLDPWSIPKWPLDSNLKSQTIILDNIYWKFWELRVVKKVGWNLPTPWGIGLIFLSLSKSLLMLWILNVVCSFTKYQLSECGIMFYVPPGVKSVKWRVYTTISAIISVNIGAVNYGM